jgi:Transglycosylase SLT domain
MSRSLIIVIAVSLAAGVCRAQESAAVKRAKAYEPLIVEAAVKHRVDPRLIWTVAYLETRFQPQQVSPKGARGLMQFMPATARRYKLQNPFDPAQAIDAAARYLRDLQSIFGDRLNLILAAYNAGEGTVEAFRTGRRLPLSNGRMINPRAIKSAIPPYKETVNYVTSGAQLFKTLTEAGYFSGPHLARLRTVDASSDEAAALITVDLEETPDDVTDLKQGSVYVLEDPLAARKTPPVPALPKTSTTQSVYSQ